MGGWPSTRSPVIHAYEYLKLWACGLLCCAALADCVACGHHCKAAVSVLAVQPLTRDRSTSNEGCLL